MKKTKNRGFTLSELLAALAVIAIVAAILLPAQTKMIPDKIKVKYLKVFNTITDAVKDFENTTNAFPVCQGDYCFEKNPLYNTTKGVGNRYPEGNGKICRMLADKFNASENTCSDSYEQFDGEKFSFTAPDGTQFFVSTYRTEPLNNKASFQTDVWFDVNGDKEPNKLYGQDGCTKPDRFKLMIAANGTVVTADPIGQAYINTSKNWINTNYEIADGSGIKNDLDLGLKDFDLKPNNKDEGNNNNNNNNNGNNGNNNKEKVDIFVTLVCGEEFYGKVVNCYNIEHAIQNRSLSYPNLFLPKKYVFQYPVMSDVIIYNELTEVPLERTCPDGKTHYLKFSWNPNTELNPNTKEYWYEKINLLKNLGITADKNVLQLSQNHSADINGSCTVLTGQKECTQSKFEFYTPVVAEGYSSVKENLKYASILSYVNNVVDASPSCNSPLSIAYNFHQYTSDRVSQGRSYDDKYWYLPGTEVYLDNYGVVNVTDPTEVAYIISGYLSFKASPNLPILERLLDKPYNKEAKEKYLKAKAEGKSVNVETTDYYVLHYVYKDNNNWNDDANNSFVHIWENYPEIKKIIVDKNCLVNYSACLKD